jgi:tetratricopeptide (TPR) repeat protein
MTGYIVRSPRRLLAAVALAVTLGAGSALAVDTPTKEAPDLGPVRAKIKAKDFKSALVDLNAMINDNVQHADVYNLMGFSLRKTGDYKTAYTFYRKALDFDPDHKGALEYLGELYVETGDLPKARENLARLEKLCPSGCEEREDLEKAIASAAASPQGVKATN